ARLERERLLPLTSGFAVLRGGQDRRGSGCRLRAAQGPRSGADRALAGAQPRLRALNAIPEKTPAHIQLRVLPAENPGRDGEVARDLEAARAVEAALLLLHLWRGRLHAGPHAGDRPRNPGRRTPRGAAYLLHRRNAH